MQLGLGLSTTGCLVSALTMAFLFVLFFRPFHCLSSLPPSLVSLLLFVLCLLCQSSQTSFSVTVVVTAAQALPKQGQMTRQHLMIALPLCVHVLGLCLASVLAADNY